MLLPDLMSSTPPGPPIVTTFQAIVSAVAPKPVNVLLSSNSGLRVSDLAELGVRRISVGSAFTRTAWTSFIRAAKELIEQGTAAAFDGTMPFAELNTFFDQDLKSLS